jgi:hypothetical protein
MRLGTVGAAILCTALAASGACRRQGAPAAEMKSETPLTGTNEQLTVSGCLKAGDATDTYVLTATSKAQGGEPAATYQLVGVEGVRLGEHIGERVEVTGLVNAEKKVATTSTTDPATKPTDRGAQPRPTDSATPMVRTETQLDIKRLDVSAIRKIADRCEM